jgi:hypothetical protein
MKTKIAIRFFAFAALTVLATLAGSVAPVRANVNTVAVGSFNVPVDHMGPGLGSVKSAPFAHIGSTSPAPVQPDTTMSFHVDTNQAVWSGMGPSQLSVKAPGIH